MKRLSLRGRVYQPQGEAEDNGTRHYSLGVAEVIELKRPVARVLLGVGTASPAEHAEGHEEERSGIALRYEIGYLM
jgi:hypothetical protein